MVIRVQKVVNCVLSINRNINNNEENSIIRGKGYYKNNDGEITIFFSSENIKYKYVYNKDCLVVYCNDSKYSFKENRKDIGEIKNGDYIFKVTTVAKKIEVREDCIILNYSLYQDDLIGNYQSVLSFN